MLIVVLVLFLDVGILFFLRKLSYIYSFYDVIMLPNNELLVVAIIHAIIFIRLRFSALTFVIAWLPLVLIYVTHDIFWGLYNKVPKLTDISLLYELFLIYPLSGLLTITPFIFAGYLLFYYRKKTRKTHAAFVIPVLVSLPIILYVYPGKIISAYEKNAMVVGWSETATVERSGRITSSIYYLAENIKARKDLDTNVERTQSNLFIGQRLAQHINNKSIHIIVMESFLDPGRFNKLSTSAAFRDKLLGEYSPYISSVVSPVFGGQTARAEFEILCGIPSLALMGGAEFKFFTGSATYCLPGILHDNGYKTIVSYPYDPGFFNAERAYASIGFSERNYSEKYDKDTYLKTSNDFIDGHMFDGELFKQNFNYIKDIDGPYLNYVIGTYGHYPFAMNNSIRPLMWTHEGVSDEMVRAVNQYYYRAIELHRYVKRLTEKDSLIIVVSDHLPLLGGYSKDEYEKYDYMGTINNYQYLNQALIVKDGNPVKYESISQYELYQIVLDYVTNNEYCRQKLCTFNKKNDMTQEWSYDYKIILGLGIK